MTTLFHSNSLITYILILVQATSVFISLFCFMSVVIAALLQIANSISPTEDDYLEYSKLSLYCILAATIAITIHMAITYGVIR